MYFRKTLSTMIVCCLFLVLLSGQACRSDLSQITVAARELSENTQPEIEIFMPADSLDPVYKGLGNNVRDFYVARNNRAVWVGHDGWSGAADSVVAFISDIRYYGLPPSNYHFEEITAGFDGAVRISARLDAVLTDAFLSIVKDLMYGRVRYGDRESDSIAMRLLDHVVANGELTRSLNSVESQLEGYRRLKNALRKLIDSLPLHHRSDVLQNSDQVPDSINTRLQAIEINLERWRAETESWGSRYILVNIPAFTLYMISDEVVTMESRVIVGKSERPTPEFTSNVECLVTYPYWHVPRRIAVEEYLPVIQRDTSFLGRNNFDVLDRKGTLLDPDSVAWKTFSKNYFPVSLRQREGKENSLGIIKFIFDNPYAVFLHDTNAGWLFNSNVRAFSHGCVRVEKAVELAHYLLTGDVSKRSKVIDRYLKDKLRHTINLPSSIPIHIRYFTTDVQDDSIVFYNDIYGKDEYLIQALYGNKHPDDRGL